jgi:hypothetical protein
MLALINIGSEIQTYPFSSSVYQKDLYSYLRNSWQPRVYYCLSIYSLTIIDK